MDSQSIKTLIPLSLRKAKGYELAMSGEHQPYPRTLRTPYLSIIDSVTSRSVSSDAPRSIVCTRLGGYCLVHLAPLPLKCCWSLPFNLSVVPTYQLSLDSSRTYRYNSPVGSNISLAYATTVLSSAYSIEWFSCFSKFFEVLRCYSEQVCSLFQFVRGASTCYRRAPSTLASQGIGFIDIKCFDKLKSSNAHARARQTDRTT
jgi:hypothetical protein